MRRAKTGTLGRMSCFDKYREVMPSNYVAAVMVIALFVWIPVKAYERYRGVYGEYAELKLLIFASLGMAAVFSLSVAQRRRVFAFIAGLVAGLTGAVIYLHVPAVGSVIRVYAAFLVGAVPGVFLYWLLRRLRSNADTL
jgi:hypothetical protein